MRLDLRELSIVINRLLDHIIEDGGVTEVEIKNVHYWMVSEDDRHDMSKSSPDVDIGSLADDWEFVSKLLNKESVPIAMQLAEVAPLVLYLGEKLGPELAKQGK